jgi:hypothetical protein
MPLLVLDLPNFGRRKYTGKRGILTKPLTFFRLGHQQRADLLQWTRQNSFPLCIAPEQRWTVGVSRLPPGEVGPRDLEQLRARAQPLRYTAGERKADFINLGMIHYGRITAAQDDFEPDFAKFKRFADTN